MQSHRNSLLVLVILILIGCKEQTKQNSSNNEILLVQEEMELLLKDKMLDVWYPVAIDSVDGGYLSMLDENWKPFGNQSKFIVTQARHVWTLAKAMERYPDNPNYSRWAEQGFQFLKNAMWDQEYGGFYELRLKDGVRPEGKDSDDKRAYGNSFGIYASAAYAKASGNKEALEFAKTAFRWLNEHSYDPDNGGYFQFLTKEGTPYHLVKKPGEMTFNQYFKDQNSSIHIMEAYTELYRIWPNDTLGQRLDELMLLIRDHYTNPEGYLSLFFTIDLKPISYRDSSIMNWNYDHVSFGHDIETAYLILDASDALGKKDPRTDTVTKKMVDHSIEKGLDKNVGGLYYKGYYFLGEMAIVDDQKSWWVEAEAMNSLLLFDGLYPNQGYLEEFYGMWAYNKRYLIDWDRGGWYNRGLDNYPDAITSNKGAHWKGPYHTFRSIANCIDMIGKRLDQ
ncbi:MAG: AGE family epimerase/isomerase [Bacteroidota bacterium]